MRAMLIGLLLCGAFTASCKQDKGPAAPAVGVADHPSAAVTALPAAAPSLTDQDFCRHSPPPGNYPEYCRRCPGVCTTNSASGGAIPEVRPGEGIGPVRLGMSQRDVMDLKLPAQPDPIGGSNPAIKYVGPYLVVFDGSGKVSSVEIYLARSVPGVRVGVQKIAANAPITEVVRVLQCGPVDPAEGGNMYRCPGQIVVKESGIGAKQIAIQVTLP